MAAVQYAYAHEGGDGGDAHRVKNLHEGFPGIGDRQATPEKEKRFFCRRDLGRQSSYLFHRGVPDGFIAADRDCVGVIVVEHFILDILRDIDYDGAGTTARGEIERLLEDTSEAGPFHYEVVVLRHRLGYADGVRFLEGVVAEHSPGDLSGDTDQGNGIEPGGRKTRHGVGGARAAGRYADADFARGPGIPVGRVDGSLFMPVQDDADVGRVVQSVEDRYGRPPRIPEHSVDVFPAQGFDYHFGSASVHLPAPLPIKKAVLPEGRTAFIVAVRPAYYSSLITPGGIIMTEEIIITTTCDMGTMIGKSTIQVGGLCQYPIADIFEKIVNRGFTPRIQVWYSHRKDKNRRPG